MDSPLVSIGVPLYNGERYLREALDSLIAQDYSNFELIISDNASTDSTEAICREYAARDARVRYYRSEQNMGAVWNFRRVYELSEGKYFMWAAFDDLRDRRYLSRCVEALEANPDAVMCCTDIMVIDENGREIKESDFPYGIRMAGPTVWQRVRAIARSIYWYDFYGLIRRDVLSTTSLPQPVWGFDVLMMMELSLRGEVLLVPEKMFSYRVVTGKTGEQAAATLGPSKKPLSINWSRLAFEMTRSIWLAPLGALKKLSLTLRFLFNFCIRNPLVRVGIYKEGISGAADAFSEGKYRLFLGLFLIAALVMPIEGVYSLVRPLRYPHLRT